MSASNAMNRKVASARNESIPQYNTNYENNNVSNRRGVSGTPIQQLWTLANFHETRLARMDKFLESFLAGKTDDNCWFKPTSESY